MLTLTQPAADYLSSARQRSNIPDDATVRIASPLDPGSTGYSIGFVDEPVEGDAVGEAHGVPLCVAPEVGEALDHSAIDVVRDNDGVRLVVIPTE
jgi:Fe-S cluster assembly iron-binding protein IscA